jgi:hypothetical protein
VVKHAPEIVGLSVTMAGSAAQRPGARRASSSRHAPRGVLVGGGGVPKDLRGDPGVHYAANARDAHAIIESLADPVT